MLEATIGKDHMDVSKNRGTLKSSILIGFSIINHPFWDIPIFGNTHIYHISSLKLTMILSIAPQKFGGLFPILSCTYRSRVIGLQLTTLYMGNGWVTPKTCLCAAENNRNLRISRKIPLFSGAMSVTVQGEQYPPIPAEAS